MDMVRQNFRVSWSIEPCHELSIFLYIWPFDLVPHYFGLAFAHPACHGYGIDPSGWLLWMEFALQIWWQKTRVCWCKVENENLHLHLRKPSTGNFNHLWGFLERQNDHNNSMLQNYSIDFLVYPTSWTSNWRVLFARNFILRSKNRTWLGASPPKIRQESQNIKLHYEHFHLLSASTCVPFHAFLGIL